MDSQLLLIVAIVAALLLGAALGWFAGSRPVAGLRGEAERLRADAARMGEERDAALARAAEREGEFKTAIKELGEAQVKLAKLEANAENFDKQMELMKEAREELLAQFRATGGEVLSKAQEHFLKTAAERFGHSEQASKEAVASLLKPVSERLQKYEEAVRSIDLDRKKDYGNIESLMEQVKLGQKAVQDEATKIVNSLRMAPKTGGRWGEQQFENLLDLAGLSKFTDYRSEVSVAAEGGTLRPDYIINLPRDRKLIVDIKCPIEAYMSAIETHDPDAKAAAFRQFSRAVQGHANALSKKAYWAQFDEAPDFVILYIPGDNFLTAALEHQPSLWEEAAKSRVVISGPATFFPLARTIAAMWETEKLTDKAQEIIDIGRDLHENMSIMTERIVKLGKSIGQTVSSYNDFVKSADGKVILRARELENLNVTKSARRIASPDTVEPEMRQLVRLSKPSASDESEQ